MLKLHRVALRTTKRQQKNLFMWSHSCRKIWNRTLKLHSYLYKRFDIKWSYFSLITGKNEKIKNGTQKFLTKLRHRSIFYRDTPTCCQQEILRDLDKAYSRFFKKLAGYPNKKKYSELPRLFFSRNLSSFSQNDKNDHITIKCSKIGTLYGRYNKKIIGKHSSITLSYDGKRWYANILIENAPKEKIMKIKRPKVGVDLGLVQTAAFSNGEISNIDKKKIQRIETHIKHLQQKLSVKTGSKKFEKKSNNYIKLNNRIRLLYRKLREIRKNYYHQLSSNLAQNFSLVAVEELKIKKMTESAKGTIENPGKNVKQKASFNCSILGQGWYMLRPLIEYKCKKYHTDLQIVNPFYTSQMCSKCHFVNAENRKTQAQFRCLKCDHTENSDVNAAKNILYFAIQVD